MEKEFKGTVINGFLMLSVILLMLLAGAALCILPATVAAGQEWMIAVGVLLIITALVCCGGLARLEPNEALVILFFGKYMGTVQAERLLLVQSVQFEKRRVHEGQEPKH